VKCVHPIYVLYCACVGLSLLICGYGCFKVSRVTIVEHVVFPMPG